MRVLGIESSCDETSAAVVMNGIQVRSHVVASSVAFHAKYGGVIPEIASRMQLETIVPVTDAALKQAGCALSDVGLVAVTDGPGLLGSLVVGVSFAKSLCQVLGIPLVGVDHLQGHVYSALLTDRVPFPFIGLVVSGGHTNLYAVKGFDRMQLIGSTLDDACGEAFDKVAKIIGLGYPGGPAIERAASFGDPHAIPFRCSTTRRPLDFSFSGIKTAVLYYAQRHLVRVRGIRKRRLLIRNIAASFQEAAVETLVNKAFTAVHAKRCRCLAIGGGVAANKRLRSAMLARARQEGVRAVFPAQEYCMDNAAMVAGLGYHLYTQGLRSDATLAPRL